MADYRRGSHTVYDIKYYFVWTTKYRYKVLKEKIAYRLRELLRQGCETRGLNLCWNFNQWPGNTQFLKSFLALKENTPDANNKRRDFFLFPQQQHDFCNYGIVPLQPRFSLAPVTHRVRSCVDLMTQQRIPREEYFRSLTRVEKINFS